MYKVHHDSGICNKEIILQDKYASSKKHCASWVQWLSENIEHNIGNIENHKRLDLVSDKKLLFALLFKLFLKLVS